MVLTAQLIERAVPLTVADHHVWALLLIFSPAVTFVFANALVSAALRVKLGVWIPSLAHLAAPLLTAVMLLVWVDSAERVAVVVSLSEGIGLLGLTVIGFALTIRN